MVFDLTSTQEATHDFIHPELVNSSLLIEIKFDSELPNEIEIFFPETEIISCLHWLRDKRIQKLSTHECLLLGEDQFMFRFESASHFFKFGVFMQLEIIP